MFGKIQRGISERSKESNPPRLSKWLNTLFFILLVITATTAFILWKPWSPVKASTNVLSTDVKDQQETNHDYRFYDQLPRQQVTPIPEQAVPTRQMVNNSVIISAPKAAGASVPEDAATTVYFLQVKSFTDPDKADARRSEILMNKLPADVITVVERGETWYRVVSGPFTTQQMALSAQQTLQNSGIDSIVIRN
ncbi:SPOR domain-containing protein [Acinetobacter apis]|uniref:Sporulation related domain-containing protein n=1 Tax=Acinetobacter apis TaxID=1229165 RepID=A0A217EHZ1_9GAMM|nr:SPOR domain-containing protein [Acinetobacter apis]SNQ29932.1 Sporulation related domain-containing protein [Acinetobacter apis]